MKRSSRARITITAQVDQLLLDINGELFEIELDLPIQLFKGEYSPIPGFLSAFEQAATWINTLVDHKLSKAAGYPLHVEGIKLEIEEIINETLGSEAESDERDDNG